MFLSNLIHSFLEAMTVVLCKHLPEEKDHEVESTLANFSKILFYHIQTSNN
jgi:hypothetical protein